MPTEATGASGLAGQEPRSKKGLSDPESPRGCPEGRRQPPAASVRLWRRN